MINGVLDQRNYLKQLPKITENGATPRYNQSEEESMLFPAKSPSTQKVFSPYPDYGEYVALKQMYQFACDINKFYKYGCKILIIADGRVYGDLIGISKENITLYKQHLLKMIKDNGFDKHLLYTNLTMELKHR